MDADIYGPSIPTMLGIGDVDPQTTAFPMERYGLLVMSMGFLLGPDKAAVLRGPMVQRYLQSFLAQIDWGQLDYLLVDMPPGTGDAQLALAQTAPVAGTIIVTTPQDVSLNVARRGVQMFRQVQVPVLGVVENMSYFVGDDGKRYDIFRSGGGRRAGGGVGRAVSGRDPDRPARGGVRRSGRTGGASQPGFSRGAGVSGAGGECGPAIAQGGAAARFAGSAAVKGERRGLSPPSSVGDRLNAAYRRSRARRASRWPGRRALKAPRTVR